MELLWTARRCLLCCGGIPDQHDWAQQFTTVFLESDGVHIGSFKHDQKEVIQKVEINFGLRRRLRVDKSSLHQNQRTFIFHTSCRKLLNDAVTPSPDPTELFKLCQILEPNKCQTFDIVFPSTLPDVTDPFLPLLPYPLPFWLQKLDISPKPGYGVPGLLQLPPEVLLIIIQRLALPDLINFLCSTKQLLSYTPLALNYRTMTAFKQFTGSRNSDYRRVILALHLKFHQTRYAGLEERWKIVSRINALSSHIHQMRKDRLIQQDDETLAHSTDNNSLSTEYHQLTLQLLNRVENFRVFTTKIDGCQYIVGLKIQDQLIGIISATSVDIDVPNVSPDVIRFGQDGIGIRSIKFGNSCWSHGSPEILQCWEGFSRRRDSIQLKILRDPLKFRCIAWLTSEPPSFPERIIAKGMHPFWHGSISEDNFIRRDFGQKPICGNVPVGIVWFNNLRFITLYYSKSAGILGVSTQTDKGTSTSGFTEGMMISLSLKQPEEFVTEMIVYKSCGIDIELRTNLNQAIRPSHVQSYTHAQHIYAFRSSAGSRLKGFYFQTNTMVSSIGPIYEDK